MTELSEAVSGKQKIMVITKMLLNLMKQNGCGVRRPLKDIAVNANDIWRQRYKISKQLHEFKIITFIRLTASQEEKTELSLQ
jgi:hypothetical protein